MHMHIQGTRGAYGVAGGSSQSLLYALVHVTGIAVKHVANHQPYLLHHDRSPFNSIRTKHDVWQAVHMEQALIARRRLYAALQHTQGAWSHDSSLTYANYCAMLQFRCKHVRSYCFGQIHKYLSVLVPQPMLEVSTGPFNLTISDAGPSAACSMMKYGLSQV